MLTINALMGHLFYCVCKVVNKIAHSNTNIGAKLVSQILSARIKTDFYSFLQKVFECVNPDTQFVGNWHLKMICDALEDCRAGKLKRLIINVPPRSLKSVCVSVAFPAWVLGHNRCERVLVASYSQILSKKHSTDCRKVMESDWYKAIFPLSAIAKGENTEMKFSTTGNGYRFATSVGGSLTGEGGNFLIADDPHNPTHINSKNARKRVIDWFGGTFATRLNSKKNGCIIIVAQRLHEDDLCGNLLADNVSDDYVGELVGSSGWSSIVLPILFTTKRDVLFGDKFYKSVQSGEALCPERDGIKEIEAIRHEVGEHVFSAQYQQMPVAERGNIVKKEWIVYHARDWTTTQWESVVMSMDCARGIGESHDYSVIVVIGVFESKHYVINVFRRKMEYTTLKEEAKKHIDFYRPTSILIEDASNGSSLIQEFTNMCIGGIVAIKPRHDKISRFNHALVAIENGALSFPDAEKHAFMKDFIDELLSFPFGKHDDQVDAIGQYFLWHANNYKNRRVHSIRMI